MENIINTTLKNIISFPYIPYIASFILATIIIFLIPFINLISTINKVGKLFDNKNYTHVIRKVERFFKFHRYEKTLLTYLYDSYLKLNNKQKALHYMQIAVEKGFIKDRYIKMFHNTKMAQILFDLNQTTESFEKLYQVEKEGKYEASWCNLIGLIFLSQQQFENAIYYLERALFISKRIADIFFNYTLALFFKLKERAQNNAMELFIKNAKKEAIFIIALYYIFKKDYSNAQLWLSKANFANNILFEFYRRFLILFSAYNLVNNSNGENSNNKTSLKFDNEILNDKIFNNPENENVKLISYKTEFLILLDNTLKSDIGESLKAKALENAIYLLRILKDKQNLNHFMIEAKTSFNLFENFDENIIFSENKIENFVKRIQHGQILLDIFGFSIKKTLIPPPEFFKKEFEQLKPTASQNEKIKKSLLSQYLRLTDRGFVKVNLRIVRLFEYIPLKIKSKFDHNQEIASLRILATEIEYPHKNALFIFRRVNLYDLSYKLFELINAELDEQNIETCYFFYNFPIDQDAEKYLLDFPKITFYDQAHLALFLEESMKVEKSKI
ncbi:MAG: tetratricopeptide repeat protein [Exilispira sp.]